MDFCAPGHGQKAIVKRREEEDCVKGNKKRPWLSEGTQLEVQLCRISNSSEVSIIYNMKCRNIFVMRIIHINEDKLLFFAAFFIIITLLSSYDAQVNPHAHKLGATINETGELVKQGIKAYNSHGGESR